MSFEIVARFQLAPVQLCVVWVLQSSTRAPAQARFRAERKDNVVAVEVGLDAHSFGISGHREMYRLTEGDGVREPHAVAYRRMENLRFEKKTWSALPARVRTSVGQASSRRNPSANGAERVSREKASLPPFAHD